MECFTHDLHGQNLHKQKCDLRENKTYAHIMDDLVMLFVKTLKEKYLDRCWVKGFLYWLLIHHILKCEEGEITLPYTLDLLNILTIYPNYVFAIAFGSDHML